MRVLLTGANGFIGSHLLGALVAEGHEVVAAVRDPAGFRAQFPGIETIAVDFNQPRTPDGWLTILQDIDAVINCVGILQSSRLQSAEAIHYLAPKALFDACVQSNVRRVIHVSAVSATPEAGTEYADTKYRCEKYLRSLPLDWVILRPSLVYAKGSHGGTSLLRGLAGLPCFLPIVGEGHQQFQPIHVNDLCKTVTRLLDTAELRQVAIDPVGPETLTLREILQALRSWLGFGTARELKVPASLVRIMTRLGDLVGKAPLNTTSLKQLEFGNISNPDKFIRQVGFVPRTFNAALLAEPSTIQDRWHARLYFVRPLLRIVLSLFWLSAALSVGSEQLWFGQPAGVNNELLHHPVAHGAVVAVCIALSVAVLFRIAPFFVATLQFAIIAIYVIGGLAAQPSLQSFMYPVFGVSIVVSAIILALAAVDIER